MAAAYVFQGVTVIGINPGKVMVTLTAQDTDGDRVSDSFTVTVRSNVNTAPRAVRSMRHISGLTEQTTKRVLLADTFRDADNDRLTITATSSNNLAVRVEVARNYHSLAVNAVSNGTGTIDHRHRRGAASTTFAVTVIARHGRRQDQPRRVQRCGRGPGHDARLPGLGAFNSDGEPAPN